MKTLAAAIRIAGWAIAAVLALGIVLVVTDANRDNGIVGAVLDAGRFIAGPFRGMFELDDKDAQVAVNWGIAAVVYVAAAIALSTILLALAARARRPRRRTAAAR